jgi:hypothetical protein
MSAKQPLRRMTPDDAVRAWSAVAPMTKASLIGRAMRAGKWAPRLSRSFM